MARVKVRLVSLLVAGLIVGAGAAAAQAGTMTVTAAVKAQDRIVKHSVAYRRLKHITASTPTAPRKLVREFRVLQLKVEHAAVVVSKATATGARQRRGKVDWVRGVRGLARGIGQLDTGLEDVMHGRTGAGKIALRRADRTLKIANVVGTRGDRLLGLPSND